MVEIRALTGLRGLAAIDVALMHIAGGETFLGLEWIAFHNPAVDTFFCLSGFTLAMVHGAGKATQISWKAFMWSRFARIYPLYIAVLMLATLYTWRWHANDLEAYTRFGFIAEGIRQALLVNAWPIIGTGAHWAPPMWSLSVESFCYLIVFPILFLNFLKSAKINAGIAQISILICTALTIYIYINFYDPRVNGHSSIPIPGVMVHWVAIIRGCAMFCAGFLAWLIAPRIKNWVIGVATCCMLAVMPLHVFLQLNAEWIILPAPFFIAGLLRKNLITRFFSNPILHFLGEISYSLYLLHWPINIILHHFFPDWPQDSCLRIGFCLALSIGVATCSYHLFERPVRQWLRGLLFKPEMA